MTLQPTLPADRLASFTLADWLIDPKACQASRGTTVLKVRPQLLDLLVCLARRPGQIVLKDEILAAVWPGQYIADSGLSRCVAELRQILQDDAQQPVYIETIPKRGYRLIAPVAWADAQPTPPASQAPGAEEALRRPAVPARDAVTAPRRPAWRWPFSAVAVLLAIVGCVAAVLWATRPRSTRITVRDTVLLADVKNATGDPAFDDALRLALAVNLEQAPFLRLLPQEEVRAALQRAGRSAEERVVGALALEICRRESAAVLLAASIASLGSRYAVGIEATACASGESIGRSLTEAVSKEGVLPALQQAATRIRERLGESRDSLTQYDAPLARATTSSWDALVAFTRGDVSRDRGRREEALRQYRQATELDGAFALAWARRGLAARNVGLRDEALPALRRAFELRARASQPERFFIEALYYRFVEGESEKAIEILQTWKRVYPGSAAAFNYVAATLSDELGQYEAAVIEAREAVRLSPNSSWAYANLVQACAGAGLFDEAKRAAAEAAARGVDDVSTHAYVLGIVQREGDRAATDRETRWGLADAATAGLWMRIKAWAAVERGRLGEARRWWRDALALTTTSAPEEAGDAAAVLLDEAEADAVLGLASEARRTVDAALAARSTAFELVRAALVLSLAGDTRHARGLRDDAARQAAADPAPMRVWLPVVDASIAAAEGRGEEALRILQPVARHEMANDFSLVPLAIRGVALLATRRHEEAAAVFSEVVRHADLSMGSWLVLSTVGVARSLAGSRDVTGALSSYDAFLESWKDAKSDLPLLRAVQRERASLAPR